MINHSLNKDVFGTGIIISDPIDAPTTNSVSSYGYFSPLPILSADPVNLQDHGECCRLRAARCRTIAQFRSSRLCQHWPRPCCRRQAQWILSPLRLAVEPITTLTISVVGVSRDALRHEGQGLRIGRTMSAGTPLCERKRIVLYPPLVTQC